MTADREARDKRDMIELLRDPKFIRFLWRVIQRARIFDLTADGSDGDTAYGRRNLGLEILEMVDEGQPVAHPEKMPVLTLLQILREETNQPAREKPNGRRNDRYAEFRDDDE